MRRHQPARLVIHEQPRALARRVAEAIGRATLAARMLLPVGAAFRALAARTVEFALAAFIAITIPRVAVAIPPRPVELRTLSTIELGSLALRTIGKRPIATG